MSPKPLYLALIETVLRITKRSKHRPVALTSTPPTEHGPAFHCGTPYLLMETLPPPTTRPAIGRDTEPWRQSADVVAWRAAVLKTQPALDCGVAGELDARREKGRAQG